MYETPNRVGLLLDMDGVIYRGKELIEGTASFLETMRRMGVPYLFLTNNSQRTRRDIVKKLSRLGIPSTPDQIFTCAIATARFLAQEKPEATAFVIGENGLASALHVNGISVVDDDPDYVVVGEGRNVNYEMVEAAVRMVAKGAKLVATNMDFSCPTESGIRPGCGAIVAMIEKATGIEAFSVGKPSPVMMRMARKELGLRTAETVMVGDTMYTDILGGVQMGYRTVLVMSGHTRRDEVSRYAYQPDLISERLSEIPLEWLTGTRAEEKLVA
ncbi:HAD-IIA family hydrolase [Roseibacillus persicicus]|uniref:Acid sugar phosphatase n=2 Tax=Roseibacillus persicicus TaxID=454148 RepID=A0A918TGH3_9BACT|nr:HAD-IIA family hydrolase [Roseibacillus persicicus]GHC45296.1 acid sugar phosphatase [Roseibacillus persicicus]